MLLCRVGATPDARTSAWLQALPVTPESALSCDTVPTLAVEFHSVPRGRGWGYPHPNRRPRSIAVLSLTVASHSVSSGRGSSYPHPNRHPRSIVVPTLAVANHSVSSCRGAGGSQPNRRSRLIGCRRSLSKCTAFRVVAGWAIHTRFGILVRLRADAHHRDSQGFECLAAMSTSVPAPRSAAQPHASMSAKAPRVMADGRPSTLKPEPGTCPPNIRYPVSLRRSDAPGRRDGGQRCGYRTAESTHNPVHRNGEGERRLRGAGSRRCGYLPPPLTRRAVDFDGEGRHALEPRTDRGVDIRPPTRLETLCNRMVSALANSARSSGIVDIPHPRPIRTLCTRWVRTRPLRGPNPCRTARERPPPRPRFTSRASGPFRGNPPAHPDTPRKVARHPERKLSQFPTETCVAFLTPAPPEQDEEKLSRLPAKK